jgi:chemotaxis protein CheD
MVGMAEVKVTRSPDDVLIALGLGSCVGICAYDPIAKVAGLSHVELPDSAGHAASPGKFANTAVPLLMEEMTRLGANVKNIRVALAGGAQLFAFNGSGPKLEIGPRNAAAVQAALQAMSIPVLVTDLGGSTGRTVHVFPDGRVRVKTIGQGEKELIALGAPPAAVLGGLRQTPPLVAGIR